jgi:diaminopimelate decarboxylase
MRRQYTESIGADDRGRLRIEDLDAGALADEFGTPLFVLSEQQLRHNVRAITRAFQDVYPRTRILYSNKANNNPSVRRIVNLEGAGGDCFGYGELYLSLLARTPPELIMLNGSNKQAPELRLAIENGVTINVDVFDELELIERLAAELGRPARVNARTRLDLHELDDVVADWPRGLPIGPSARAHKFGMTYPEVREVCAHARSSRWLELRGLHHHAGRWTNELRLNEAVVREQVAWAARLRDELDWTPELLNMGGGLAWGRPEGHGPDGNDRTAPDYAAYAAAIAGTLLRELDGHGLGRPLLMIEPGRALASNIGVLLTRVGVIKRTPGLKTWVNVDASQNHLANILTANWYYHAVAAHDADPPDERLEEVDLVGPLCTFDVMGAARRLPALQRDDIVALLDAGAYGETKAATFNAQPRPATVLVSGRRAEIITERETLREVIGRYRIPAHLLGDDTAAESTPAAPTAVAAITA